MTEPKRLSAERFGTITAHLCKHGMLPEGIMHLTDRTAENTEAARDRPDALTPAMLEAGVDELRLHDLSYEPAEDVVRQVFFAMLRARP